jgi:hypothetical protein
MGMSANQHQDDPEDEAFLRQLVLPQEECMRLGILWHGGYRRSRSPNVVRLEQWHLNHHRPDRAVTDNPSSRSTPR